MTDSANDPPRASGPDGSTPSPLSPQSSQSSRPQAAPEAADPPPVSRQSATAGTQAQVPAGETPADDGRSDDRRSDDRRSGDGRSGQFPPDRVREAEAETQAGSPPAALQEERRSGDRRSEDRRSGDRRSEDRRSGEFPPDRARDSEAESPAGSPALSPQGERRSGDRRSEDRRSGDRRSGDRRSGDRRSGDRRSVDRRSGDVQANGPDALQAPRLDGEAPAVDRSSGDRRSGDRRSGDRRSGDRRSGDRRSGDVPPGPARDPEAGSSSASPAGSQTGSSAGSPSGPSPDVPVDLAGGWDARTEEAHPPSWFLGLRIAAGLGAVVIVAVLLIQLKVVLLPTILAFLACCVLNPMVEVFHDRWRLPRFLAVILSLAVGLGLIWLLFNYVLACLTTFTDGFPKYSDNIDQVVALVTDKVSERFDFITLPMLRDQLSNISVGAILSRLLNYVMSLTWQLALTILFTLYFLPALPTLPQKLRAAFPGERGRRLDGSVAVIISQVQRYILAKTLMSLALGLAVTLVCFFFKVDFSGTWGVFAFFLNFIPNIGVPVAVIPPALVCLFQYDLASAVKLLLVLLAMQVYHGNWLEPRALGRSVDLSPSAALLALLVWGWLWGLVGTILAVPLMAVVQLTCQNIPGLRPVSRLIGR